MLAPQQYLYFKHGFIDHTLVSCNVELYTSTQYVHNTQYTVHSTQYVQFSLYSHNNVFLHIIAKLDPKILQFANFCYCL